MLRVRVVINARDRIKALHFVPCIFMLATVKDTPAYIIILGHKTLIYQKLDVISRPRSMMIVVVYIIIRMVVSVCSIPPIVCTVFLCVVLHIVVVVLHIVCVVFLVHLI